MTGPARDVDPLDDACPQCGRPVGDHTLRGWGACLDDAGLAYTLPYEDDPAGPLRFPGTDGHLVGEVTVGPGFMDTPMGRLPVLRLTFTGPGPEPMSRRSLPPITLVMDAQGLKTVRQLVATAVDRAILAARRGR